MRIDRRADAQKRMPGRDMRAGMKRTRRITSRRVRTTWMAISLTDLNREALACFSPFALKFKGRKTRGR